ncbi:MAG TPA: hypothetical protein DCM87_03555 [Planctomycetes bacterium]|nr:hypothetical protein [Planctomycetota bacterium]
MNRSRRSSFGGGALAPLVLLACAALCRGAEIAPPAPGEGLDGLFDDITKNIALIERMLNRKESGEECQSLQKQVVSDIDELIEALRKMQSSSSGGGGSSSSQPQDGKESEDQKAEKKRRELEKMEGRKPEGKKPGAPEGAKPEQGKEPQPADGELRKDGKEQPGKLPNDDVKKAAPPPAGVAGPLTEKGGTGGWGFLPGEVRALIEASGRPGVPAKYEGLIRRYFERLSEGDTTK